MTKTDNETDKDSVSIRLAQFFRALKQEGIITSVVADLGDELVPHVLAQGYSSGRAELTKQSFKKFDVDPQKCDAGRKLSNAVLVALTKISFHSDRIDRIAQLYKSHTGHDLDAQGHATGYGLFKRHDAPPLGQRSKLLGDYVMFRAERRRSASNPSLRELRCSRNFLRFYPHNQTGLRFMMLSMAASNDYLAAKGWVNDLEQSYLCVGQVVTRKARSQVDERTYGGISTLVVQTDDHAPFTGYKIDDDGKRLIEAAPVLHIRALYGQQPSLARGFLLRATGAEKQGLGASEAARYLAIKALQKKLAKTQALEHTPEETAGILAAYTKFPKHYFYRQNGPRGPQGLLANLPFAEYAEAGVESWPINLPDNEFPHWMPEDLDLDFTGKDRAISLWPRS